MNETETVKFRFQSNRQRLAVFPGLEEANRARQELRRMGLLGVDENEIGFGNISLRAEGSRAFYITGSGTGCLASLGADDYAKVVAWDFDRNWLRSEGLVIPSAESLTHAAIYEGDPGISVVLHGHDDTLWRRLLVGPATAADVTYGTPAMAREVQRLFRETNARERKLFAMAGHKGGMIAFGTTFPEALAALRRLQN